MSLSNPEIVDKYKQTRDHLKEQLAILFIRTNQSTDLKEIEQLTKTIHEIETELFIVTESLEHETKSYIRSLPVTTGSVPNSDDYVFIVEPSSRHPLITSTDVPFPPHYIEQPNYTNTFNAVEPIVYSIKDYGTNIDPRVINSCVCSICCLTGHTAQYHDEFVSSNDRLLGTSKGAK